MIQVYQNYPFADIISAEYYYLCDRVTYGSSAYEAPHIGDITRETWESADRRTIEKSIQEAVFRRDYELLNMDRNDFIDKAYKNEVRGFEVQIVPFVDIQEAVYRYLIDHRICFTNYDDKIVNCPFGSGVW